MTENNKWQIDILVYAVKLLPNQIDRVEGVTRLSVWDCATAHVSVSNIFAGTKLICSECVAGELS